MAGITFPERLTTARTQRNSSVSAGNHNSQIDTLEARDQFMLDFLSTFDAIPIGTIMPTTINFIDYGENKNMPDGWVWADGRELTASEYPKLYALVKDSMLEPDEYLAQVDPEYSTYVSQGNIGAFYNMVPCGYYVHTSGDKNSLEGTKFRIPNLKNVYVRSAGSVTDSSLVGSYQKDTIKSHKHNIKAYPSNGVDLTKDKTKIGVALTDQIDTRYNNLTGEYYSSENNGSYGEETRPKSIVYRYMLKVEYKNPFSQEGNVEVDAQSVMGYRPSTTAPEDPSVLLFPIPDSTGKLDPNWIDPLPIAREITESNLIQDIINNNSLLKTDISEDAAASKIPVANAEGKVDSDYLYLLDNETLHLNLFPDMPYSG